MCSSKTDTCLTPALQQTLLDTARASIKRGLSGEFPSTDASDYPEPLRVPRATFVTLHVNGQLHGCIGTLVARKSLVEDVVRNAWCAAFHDTRFPALTRPEFERLEIHISLLGTPEELACSSETTLLAQLRPGIDGLILEDGDHCGTFLPSVWEQIPAPRDFLRQLKIKAGLPQDYWSDHIRIQRYTVETIT